tara:strand:- start:634 stop:1953 length:1320 start_codon:yes stop_codon:yes gene_type:complete
METKSLIENQYLLDAPTYEMNSTSNERHSEVKTDNSVITNDQVFRLQLRDTTNWFNLSKSYLEIKFRITEANGTPYASGEVVALQNHALSLFSRATLRLGGNIVEDVNEVALTTMFKSLLNYSQDYAVSSGSNSLFYKDEALGGADVAEFIGSPFTARNSTFNKGYFTRYNLMKNSQYVTACVPLMELFSCASVDRCLGKGVECVIELTKNSNASAIHTLSITDAVVEMSKISAWISYQTPQPEVELSLNSAVANGLISTFNFPHYSTYTSSTIPSASSGVQSFRINTQSQKPMWVFLMLRKSAQSQPDNSQVSVSKMTNLHVRVNGKQYPENELVATLDAGNYDDFARVYADLVSYLNKVNDYSNGISISATEWANTHSIFAVDLTALPENITQSPIDLEARFTLVSGGVDCVLSACVMSEKSVYVNYRGQSAVVSQD